MRRRQLVLTLPVLSLAGRSVLAQTSATKPLTIIVAYPPGGSADAAARRLRGPLERELVRPVLVQNIAGAGGAIGAQKLLQSEPDGDTALFGSPNEIVLAPTLNRSVRYEPSHFASVGVSATTPLLLATGASSKFTSIRRLQEHTRSKPGREVSYASPGVGTLHHLVAAKLLSDLGIRALHVPYKGGMTLIQDLVGKQVGVSVVSLSGVVALLASGHLRNLGLLVHERVPFAPQLATFKETAGIDEPEYTIWGGLFVPAATPIPVQQVLNDAFNAVLRDPAWRAATASAGSQPAQPMSLRELGVRLEAQTAQFASIARKLAIQVD